MHWPVGRYGDCQLFQGVDIIIKENINPPWLYTKAECKNMEIRMSQGAGTKLLRSSCILTKSKVHANNYILKLKQLNLFTSQK